MSMNDFRRLAARIDQHMLQLAAQGIDEPGAIIHRMLGYIPDLHKIWIGTSDQQLAAMANEFPGFYRYAFLMEEASEAERKKASRPYDDLAALSETNQQQAAQLLVTAAILERGYQTYRGDGNRQVFPQQLDDLGRRHRQWLADRDRYIDSLRAQGAEPKALAYVVEAFGSMADRIKRLCASSCANGQIRSITLMPVSSSSTDGDNSSNFGAAW